LGLVQDRVQQKVFAFCGGIVEVALRSSWFPAHAQTTLSAAAIDRMAGGDAQEILNEPGVRRLKALERLKFVAGMERLTPEPFLGFQTEKAFHARSIARQVEHPG
jgi:hypothetical protein